MDPTTAALIQNARDLAQWAAGAVVETDALIATANVRPLSPQEQGANLRMQRELLVRLSQRETLVEWALETRKMSWWVALKLRVRGRRP